MSMTSRRKRPRPLASSGAGTGALAGRPKAVIVVTSQRSGMVNSAATPARLKARNWRAASPSAYAWIVM
jgi:hypothetical protein